jgi:hypothetical protein
VAFPYQLVEGRIAERWAIRDDLTMLRQLGALHPWPSRSSGALANSQATVRLRHLARSRWTVVKRERPNGSLKLLLCPDSATTLQVIASVRCCD